MEHVFRIFDYNVYNEKKSGNEDSSSNDEEQNIYKDSSKFLIQIFGLNETGQTCSIFVEDFKPFFYVLVNDHWDIRTKNAFLQHIKQKMGKYYEESITNCIIVKRKKLYGFDAGKEHKFVKFEFSNINAFNKAKNLWYTDWVKDGRKLIKDGYYFDNTYIKIYESNIPPLLRFFHIRDISPSGWIALPNKKTISVQSYMKKTNCDYEFIINYKNIVIYKEIEFSVFFNFISVIIRHENVNIA
jgi:DNA polymerase elongation subunit (family B)